MTIRAYVRCWWTNDPHVFPCPLCGCPIQALAGRIPKAMAAHYGVVHPGVAYTESEVAR